MNRRTNAALAEHLFKRGFNIMDRRGMKLPRSAVSVADVGCDPDTGDVFIVRRPESTYGLVQALHEVGHIRQARRLAPGNARKQRRIIRTGSDVGACWMALWTAWCLRAPKPVIEELEHEYNVARDDEAASPRP